ncbi:ABC transporter ATP-binding protein [Clostridium gasigenes]|uniref:ABC transporter ATP-binding protein n=1 Tax=Clostridium gasigenes TaxID=94869 RepID=UPI0016262A12|nr:ABC transporter ATP-binding protein [Clostridium gasigenes]MBB6623519.1 ABC transporter ATP-binding protein [Clostridium gasigenes]
MSLIELNQIRKIYGKGEAETIALDNINLNIESGEMVAIMGQSGCGKSTLLNIIGCLDKQTSGEYLFNGKCINDYTSKELAGLRNSEFGFIVQYFALIDNYTVYENVEIPLVYNKKKNLKIKRRELIKDTLDKLGIANKIKSLPSELSGGQCQRVAIARAIVNNPRIILADEPTGALDRKNGQQVIDILKELNKNGKTIIIITHDEYIASQCSRIIRISDGNLVGENY